MKHMPRSTLLAYIAVLESTLQQLNATLRDAEMVMINADRPGAASSCAAAYKMSEGVLMTHAEAQGHAQSH